MQAIAETLFDLVYLISVLTIGVVMIWNSGASRQFRLFGWMAVVLGAGDHAGVGHSSFCGHGCSHIWHSRDRACSAGHQSGACAGADQAQHLGCRIFRE